jgi:hypothetical protein
VPENDGPNSFSGANSAIFSVKCVKVENIIEKVTTFEILRDKGGDIATGCSLSLIAAINKTSYG